MEILVMILFAIPAFAVTAAFIVGVIVRFVRSFNHDYGIKSPQRFRKPFAVALKLMNVILPAVVSVIAPIGGLILSFKASPYTVYDDMYYAYPNAMKTGRGLY